MVRHGDVHPGEAGMPRLHDRFLGSLTLGATIPIMVKTRTQEIQVVRDGFTPNGPA